MPAAEYTGYSLTVVFEIESSEQGFAKYDFLKLRKGECAGFVFKKDGVATIVCRLQNGGWGLVSKRI